MLFRKSKNPLAPPPPGLGDFWATVHVKLSAPITDPTDPLATPTQGYYRNFGVRAAPSRVPSILGAAVSDGAIEWNDTEWNLVQPENLDKAIRKQVEPIEGEGIWYKSGCVFYSDPDFEPAPS